MAFAEVGQGPLQRQVHLWGAWCACQLPPGAAWALTASLLHLCMSLLSIFSYLLCAVCKWTWIMNGRALPFPLVNLRCFLISETGTLFGVFFWQIINVTFITCFLVRKDTETPSVILFFAWVKKTLWFLWGVWVGWLVGWLGGVCVCNLKLQRSNQVSSFAIFWYH